LKFTTRSCTKYVSIFPASRIAARYAHAFEIGARSSWRIRRTRAAVIGGVGIHVIQQLTFLGVRMFALVEAEEIDDTNRNRFMGVRHDDPVPGTLKLAIAERPIRSVEPDAEITEIPRRLVSIDMHRVSSGVLLITWVNYSIGVP
jgi:tRNA A37 threonylcarbamoyladenosine dehydratase